MTALSWDQVLRWRLDRQFLGTYGPAGPEEFARWFDVKPALAKAAFRRLDAARHLAHVTVDAMPGAGPADQLGTLAGPRRRGKPTVLLLPAFNPIGAAGHKEEVSPAAGLDLGHARGGRLDPRRETDR